MDPFYILPLDKTPKPPPQDVVRGTGRQELPWRLRLLEELLRLRGAPRGDLDLRELRGGHHPPHGHRLLCLPLPHRGLLLPHVLRKVSLDFGLRFFMASQASFHAVRFYLPFLVISVLLVISS